MSGDPAMRRPHKISSVVLQQEGIFRTNCLDCLDRTNLIQTIISQMAIESFLGHRRERASPDFWMRHSALWADNGDSLSKIYAGTGALKSSFTRHGKMSFAGAIADARKSATRMYINNFADKGRQNTIDMLLGRLMGQIPVHLYDPVNDYTIAELNKRSSEFSSSQLIHIWVGTFNLNGRSHGVSEDLSPWLFASADMTPPPEIYAVGFQEIVELSPQQIMSTDPERRQAWETAVKKTLNRNAAQYGTDEYVLLRSGQLVGAALSIFVKASVLPNIKNVEGSVKKTGMSGMAGNKGAVAIRMDYANTQICFVTAHLAAGFANYEERNRDFRTISHGLKFQRNRSIEDHDTIIWLGDFNYRIGLSDEKVRRLIQVGDLDTLYENDQLNLQMVAGLTFPFYSEAKIGFNPTYKYDNGTDNYDTSEKARIPAWCDRILRKGDNLRQINYNAAPLRFSDHRPIYATFQCTISAINESLRETISHAIYEKRKEELGGSVTNGAIDDAEEEDLIGYNSIAPGLPPASSDRQKWWLENGVPARSTIKPPSDQFIPNPSRPSNPFAPATEEEWISKRDLVKPQSRSKASPSEDIKSPISTTTGAANPKHSLSPQRQTTRKAAPPIPKKPALLASREIGIINPAENTERIPETANNVTISSRDRSVNRTVDHDARIRSQGVNPLEMRPASLEHMRSRRESVPDGPPLPPRRKTVVHDASGLLDDDDIGIDSVGLWKPLQPQ
ncbi:MAG: hypothetical protein M1819_007360 [Sarea resinae]|nr:MAG: hypothetical protein M1819_007360 [Sarea resinae]